MLYRAFACIGNQETEHTVFFECHGTDPASKLLDLLSLAWGFPVSQLDCYNVYSELELRQHWNLTAVAERGADRDAVLLQTGEGPDGAHFAAPDRTLLLVSPRWFARLFAAQQHVARLQAGAAIRRISADIRSLSPAVQA